MHNPASSRDSGIPPIFSGVVCIQKVPFPVRRPLAAQEPQCHCLSAQPQLAEREHVPASTSAKSRPCSPRSDTEKLKPSDHESQTTWQKREPWNRFCRARTARAAGHVHCLRAYCLCGEFCPPPEIRESTRPTCACKGGSVREIQSLEQRGALEAAEDRVHRPVVAARQQAAPESQARHSPDRAAGRASRTFVIRRPGGVSRGCCQR